MEFPEGNQLWQLRTKHGRDHLFKTPEALWDAACIYFQWCDEHPVYQVVRGHSSQPVLNLPKLRAYTLKGLCVYLGCGSKYFNHFEAALADKTDEQSVEFLRIISLIRDVIYEQKFTAAAVGELNPSLIARELNLCYNSEAAIKNDTVKEEVKKPRNSIKWGDYVIEI